MRLNGTVFRHIWQMTISNILRYKGSTIRQFGHFQGYKRYFPQNVNQNENFYLMSSNRSSSTEILEPKLFNENQNFSLKRSTVQYTSSFKRLRTPIKFSLRVRLGLKMLMATMSITMKNIKRFWGILFNENEFYKSTTLSHFLKP